MLLRDGLIKLCQSDDASLDHSSWRGMGRRRGGSEEEGGESFFFKLEWEWGGGGEEVKKGRGEWRRRAWRISRLDWEMYERARAPNFVMHCGTPCWPCCTFVDLAVLSWHSLGIVNTLQRAELTLLTQYMRKPGWAGAMYERAVLLQIIRNRFSTFYFVQHGRSRVGGAVR